jgi:hypothetical protein
MYRKCFTTKGPLGGRLRINGDFHAPDDATVRHIFKGASSAAEPPLPVDVLTLGAFAIGATDCPEFQFPAYRALTRAPGAPMLRSVFNVSH